MRKGTLAALALLGAGLAAAGAAGGFWYATMHAGMAESGRLAQAPAAADRKVLYWHDPMFPQQKFDKPGKSPFMDMQLVPVYADSEAAGAGEGTPGVRINPEASQNLGMRTVDAKTVVLAASMEAVGTVAYDESAIEVVQARAAGWIEKLHARTPNDAVAAGAPLASIYAPEWLAAQEEYLALMKSGNPELASAARARLALLGIPETLITALDGGARSQTRVTLTAPQAGVLLPLSAEMAGAGAFAREGMQVTPGMTLFRIASLARVWVLAEVPEVQSGSLRAGQAVEVRVQAQPGRVFKGLIAVLLPEVDAGTRTLRARIRVDNPGGLLRPGMFVTLAVNDGSRRSALVVPAEAVIATGKRKLVMVAGSGGKFSQREIDTGMEVRQDGVEMVEVTRGLASGEKIVVSGQFLLDSEASLKAPPVAPAPTTGGAAAGAAAGGATKGAALEHRGEARVESIAGNTVTLSHGPIASLKWPSMTMDFGVPAAGLPPRLAVGDRVDFSFVPAKDGEYRITRITPLAAVPNTTVAPAKGAKP